jgi:CDGSH-type Zn-finger protein/uncharacterized Fe-S cluster protein YjdI
MKRKFQTYEGRQVTVQYERKRCIHAEECVRGLPEVFNIQREPWVVPDGATLARLVDVIHRCPTGALYYARKDGGPGEQPAEHNVVTVSADGPLYVRGDIVIVLPDGLAREMRAALCRCGASRYKPFCDGNHREAAFRDPGRAPAAASGAEIGSGRFAVQPMANGPLLVGGPFEIRDAGGTVIYRGSGTALCRCGSSANKPFCDGSHSRVGFQTD